MPPGVLREVLGTSWTTEDLPAEGWSRIKLRSALGIGPMTLRPPRTGFCCGYVTSENLPRVYGHVAPNGQFMSTAGGQEGRRGTAPSTTSSLEYIRLISHSSRICFHNAESSRTGSGAIETARQGVAQLRFLIPFTVDLLLLHPLFLVIQGPCHVWV